MQRQLWLEPLESRQLMAADVRSIDGTDNNLTQSEWGSAGVELLRTAPPEYTDGISSPAGADRPSAREISNVIVAHPEDEALSNNRNLSARHPSGRGPGGLLCRRRHPCQREY